MEIMPADSSRGHPWGSSMKSASLCVLVAAAAVLAAGPARAETIAEYSNPGAAGHPSSPFSHSPTEPVKTKPRPANPAMFAAAAAANNKRMSAQQRDEWRFLKETAATGRFESEASRLALGKSSNPAVRSFAATLINHHTAAGNELLHMLHVRGMAAPMLANDQRKTLNRLARLQGAKFDREYMEEVGLKNQQDDVQSFERASHNTRDPQLKAWIDRTLPTLRYHLTLVERMVPPDTRLARTGPVSGARQAGLARQAFTQPLTAEPFVSRANLATRSMGAGASQLGLFQPGLPPSTEPNSR